MSSPIPRPQIRISSCVKKKLVLGYTLECHDNFGLNWPCTLSGGKWPLPYADDGEWRDTLQNEAVAWERCDALSDCRFVQRSLQGPQELDEPGPARDHIGLRADIAGMDHTFSPKVIFVPSSRIFPCIPRRISDASLTHL